MLRDIEERCAPLVRTVQERCAPLVRTVQERCAPLVRTVQERCDPLLRRVREHGGALVRSIYDGRRPPSRLTLGVAAATVVAVTGVIIGLSVTGAPTARLDGQQAPLSGLASGVAQAAAAAPVTGHTARPGHAPGGQASAAHAAPTPSAPSPAPSQHQATTPAPAKPAPPSAPAPQPQPTQPQPTQPPQPYLIYDSVTPTAIPADHPVVATYADGPNPTPASEVAGRDSVLWIDINGSDPQAGALDIEPGCAEPSQAAGWVASRLHDNPNATAVLYTMISEWPAVQSDVASLPSWMQGHIRWWIADPTGQPHIVPGSQATQWYWGPNYDISTAEPGF